MSSRYRRGANGSIQLRLGNDDQPVGAGPDRHLVADVEAGIGRPDAVPPLAGGLVEVDSYGRS
ncbi:hypothetical protein BRC65_08300 [Halobacteriales archaeon QH_2_65_14]|nr:MAG: hypothetical protein BRC65_08300 [Halobacteriales archaeon QH_2_65_14]